MVRSITSLAGVLQGLLLADADQLARDVGLVRRERKLGGSRLAQTLVLGWLAQPHATLEQLCSFADNAHGDFSTQALDQRLRCPAAVDFFGQLLAHGLQYSFTAQATALPLLRRFEGVYVFDTTHQRLPDALAAEFPGQGGRTPADGRAEITAQVCLELSGQGLVDLQVGCGRTDDLAFELAHTALPTGALRLADRGFNDLALFASYNHDGVFWLGRLQPGVWVADGAGRKAKPDEYLRGQDGWLIDRPVRLGARGVEARLVAWRLSPEVAGRRRQRLVARRRRKGKPVSPAALALCDWDVSVTNVPAERLDGAEVVALRRLRWQVELLFKLWKSAGGLKRVGGRCRERVLVEWYAKLLGQVIAGWQLLVSGCDLLRWSWYRGSLSLRPRWAALLLCLCDVAALAALLEAIGRRLRRLRKKRRRRQPAAFEMAEDPHGARYAQEGAWALS
jgi:DDE family transposase